MAIEIVRMKSFVVAAMYGLAEDDLPTKGSQLFMTDAVVANRGGGWWLLQNFDPVEEEPTDLNDIEF